MKAFKSKWVNWSLLLLLCVAVVGSCDRGSNSDSDSATATPFAGAYLATDGQTNVAAVIAQEQSLIRGSFAMNGGLYQILATTSSSTEFQGKILNEDAGTFYDVAGQLRGDVLHWFITFPEPQNKVVELVLTKPGNLPAMQASPPSPEPSTPPAQATAEQVERNPKLIGTWLHTEVLGGGEVSVVSDVFVEFKPDGECLSWSGSSAGSAGDITLENRGNGAVTRERWYTVGKNLVIVDPASGAETSITFFADESRMMLKGSSSTVYERVR